MGIEQINEEIRKDPLIRSSEAFDFFDRERRGRVGAAELTNLIRCCGQRPLDAQVKAAVDRLIERGDLSSSVHGTAGFTYDDFKLVLLEIHEENKDYDAHKALVNAFGAFDTGKDGAVSDGMVSVTKLGELTDDGRDDDRVRDKRDAEGHPAGQQHGSVHAACRANGRPEERGLSSGRVKHDLPEILQEPAGVCETIREPSRAPWPRRHSLDLLRLEHSAA